jgi:hypothetical protein
MLGKSLAGSSCPIRRVSSYSLEPCKRTRSRSSLSVLWSIHHSAHLFQQHRLEQTHGLCSLLAGSSNNNCSSENGIEHMPDMTSGKNEFWNRNSPSIGGSNGHQYCDIISSSRIGLLPSRESRWSCRSNSFQKVD